MLVFVPIQSKILHDGHRTLIRFGEGMGDVVTAVPADSILGEDVLHKASMFISGFNDLLMLDRHKQLAIRSIAHSWVRGYSLNPDITIRGPEALGFFHKTVSKLLGWSECIVFDKIIKDPATGLKLQSSTIGIPTHLLRAISRKIADIRLFLRPGNNQKLVNDINHSYTGEWWRFEEVGVIEGRCVGGRLETFIITIDTKSGPITIEDVNYEGT